MSLLENWDRSWRDLVITFTLPALLISFCYFDNSCTVCRVNCSRCCSNTDIRGRRAPRRETLKGNVRASCSEVLKLQGGVFRAMPVFAGGDGRGDRGADERKSDVWTSGVRRAGEREGQRTGGMLTQ